MKLNPAPSLVTAHCSILAQYVKKKKELYNFKLRLDQSGGSTYELIPCTWEQQVHQMMRLVMLITHNVVQSFQTVGGADGTDLVP